MSPATLAFIGLMLLDSGAADLPRSDASLGAIVVRPPPGWKTLEHSRSNIFLVRPDVSFTGPIQPDSQSRINIGPVAGSGGLEADLKTYAQDGDVRSRRRLEPHPDSPCRSLTEQVVAIDSLQSGDPSADKIIYTEIFCQTEGATYASVLSFWHDARHRQRDTRALLHLMQGLRPARGSPGSGATAAPRPQAAGER